MAINYNTGKYLVGGTQALADNWSMSGFFSSTNIGAVQILFGSGPDASAPVKGFLIGIISSNIHFQAADGIAAWPYVNMNGNQVLLSNTEYMWGLTRAGTSLKFYINGALTVDRTIGGNALATSVLNLHVARHAPNPINQFLGYAWDFRIYPSKVLTGDEMKTIYNSNGMDNFTKSDMIRVMMREGADGANVTAAPDLYGNQSLSVVGVPTWKKVHNKVVR
ncbi:hypothetical protein KAR91_33055 [Candidatus Pacearchaeota archaeon]|nr:hypothetical protein [Candidatus Pacearchaeota archaeon]